MAAVTVAGLGGIEEEELLAVGLAALSETKPTFTGSDVVAAVEGP